MNYASISIDRREAYYERVASLIAADPLGFYSRAEAGRRVQGGVKRKDYMTPMPISTNVTYGPWPRLSHA